jgi:hypothetical protein
VVFAAANRAIPRYIDASRFACGVERVERLFETGVGRNALEAADDWGLHLALQAPRRVSHAPRPVRANRRDRPRDGGGIARPEFDAGETGARRRPAWRIAGSLPAPIVVERLCRCRARSARIGRLDKLSAKGRERRTFTKNEGIAFATPSLEPGCPENASTQKWNMSIKSPSAGTLAGT